MVKDIVLGLVSPISALLSEVVEDKDKRNELAHEIATLSSRQAHENALAQLEVNKVEAAHKNLFVAGWRPALGWLFCFILAFNYVLAPLATAAGFKVITLASSEIMPVLLGMLGLTGARTIEKGLGVARKH